MDADGLMTLDEAADFLGVAKITLRRWTRNGELPCVRIGRRGDRRFRRADLEVYLRRGVTADSAEKSRRGRPRLRTRNRNRGKDGHE